MTFTKMLPKIKNHNLFRFLFLCLLPVYFHDVILANPDTVSVVTKNGKVEGLRFNTEIDNLTTVTSFYDRFYGIPFAKPPIGKLRFEAPQAISNWSRTLNVKELKPSCPQINNDKFYGEQSEDCLYLNIFSPYDPKASQKKYPVIFVIHGGSYETGAGHVYNGKVLSLLGVVVVNFNYRLGALGFLTSNDTILPGNYGLLDVLMALKWVNVNIKAFRGDPAKLTLLGHGVGAAMAGMMMTIPSTKGLFWAAIAHSGSATSFYSHYINDSMHYHHYLNEFASLVNCSGKFSNKSRSSGLAGSGLVGSGLVGSGLVGSGLVGSGLVNASVGVGVNMSLEYVVRTSNESEDVKINVTHIKECLKTVPYELLVGKSSEFSLNTYLGTKFRPIIGFEPLFEQPLDAIEAGRYHKVPYYTGVVENELDFYVDKMMMHCLNFIHQSTLEMMDRSFACKERNVRVPRNIIMQYYIDWKQSEKYRKAKNWDKTQIVYKYAELLSDFQMVAPHTLIATSMSKTNLDVYMWLFRHAKSVHSFDLNFLFGVPFGNERVENHFWNYNWTNVTSDDIKISKKMMKLWVSIAEKSKPKQIDGVDWPRFNTSTQHYITISSSTKSTVHKNYKREVHYFHNQFMKRVFYDICDNSIYGKTYDSKYNVSDFMNITGFVRSADTKDYISYELCDS